jgi:IS5 family transposase
MMASTPMAHRVWGARISVSKRRHGLNRSRYPGDDGMKRWVGLGVIADNLVNLGHAIAARPAN